MVKTHKTILFSALSVIGLLALVVFFFHNPNRLQATETITIAVADQPAFALIYVADKKGFFKQQGLNVAFTRHALGRDALRDVTEGRADLGTAFDVATVNYINQGFNLGILTTLHSSDRNHSVATFTNSGIKTAQDFLGKKIAMTRGTSTEFYLYSYLMEQGIELSEVTIINLEPQLLIPSLENRTVDAAVLFNPHDLNFKKRHPTEQINFFYSETYSEATVLTGKQDFILNNEEKIKRTLRALYSAEQFVRHNKEESIQLVQDWLSDYSVEDLRSIWGKFTFYLKIDNKLFSTMSREAKFFRDTGIYAHETPYLRPYFFDDYLQELYPERVTLY
jgi:ABC-type nitrate/sulfonate/bicarbonate transport system substrate-binding protein